jgi:phenylpyruvate tautomerase PptA (4-oxalocrotonate tautomerase family)
MPHFTVDIWEEALDGEVEPALIGALTESVVRVYGDRARSRAVVGLRGVPRRRWGVGGEPARDHRPIVTLSMREPALHMVDNAPARLISSITDAVVDVLGDGIREHLTVVIEGVPTGRSGVAGAPV